ncbi:MAG: hypothetical protein IT320_24620 [Anaerolineae bacterium]|nr:hypothetical protein [Anaerolineae bacterium]
MSSQPSASARARLRASLLIAIAMVALVGTTVIAFFGTNTAVLLGLFTIGIVIIGGALLIHRVAQQQTAPEKDKRGLGDLDMYSLINRLVDDLDDDELAYLERKLDERRQRLDGDLPQDIGLLLEQRQEARQARKRS